MVVAPLCSVCGSESTSFHLGVQACRACAVFFRRTRDRVNPYECKGDGTCDNGNFPCKKCRFDKFQQLLKEKKMKRTETRKNLKTQDVSTPSTSSPTVQPSLPIYERGNEESIIDKIKAAYRMVGLIRRTSELSMRSEERREHPMSVGMGEYSLHPTTTSLMNDASRLLASTLVEFAASSFEEFADLSAEDKWQLVKHFHKPFHIYDSCYRSNLAFPGKFTRHFNSFTTYLDLDHLEQFVQSSPGKGLVEDAVRMGRFHLESNVRPCRIAMERFDPSEQEFAAMLGIQFWTLDMNLPVSDEIHELADKYRSIVLRDLRKFYAQTGIAEYGSRIGELFCTNNLLTAKVESNKQHFELFRLLDVFTDESFVYSMQK